MVGDYVPGGLPGLSARPQIVDRSAQGLVADIQV
jgi:hypothetical protein